MSIVRFLRNVVHYVAHPNNGHTFRSRLPRPAASAITTPFHEKSKVLTVSSVQKTTVSENSSVYLSGFKIVVLFEQIEPLYQIGLSNNASGESGRVGKKNLR